MQRYYKTVLDANGNPASGVQVLVTDAATNLPATLYYAADDALTSSFTIANPIVTAADGVVAFAAPNGRYKISFTGSNITPRTEMWVTISDIIAGGGSGGVAIAAGTNTATSGTVEFGSTAGNITFGMNPSGYVTGSAPAGTGLVGTGFTGTNATGTMNSNGLQISVALGGGGTWAGTAGAITGGSITVNTSGISVALPAYLTTAQPVGAYLTTAMASADSSKFAATGFTTTSVAGAVVAGTHDTAGLKLAVPAYLTTAMGSADSSKFAATGFTTTATAGTAVVATHDTAGLKLGVPAFITTYAAGQLTITAGTTNGALPNVSFGNANGVSFGLNGSTITGSISTHPAPATLSNWWNMPMGPGMVTGASGLTRFSGSSLVVQPFILPQYVSMDRVRFLASWNDNGVGTGGTTSAGASFSVQRYTTIGMVIYSQGGGTDSLALRYMASTSAGLTGQTAYVDGGGGAYSIFLNKSYPVNGTTSQFATNYGVTSNSIVINSGSNTLFTGPRFLDIPWATSLTPGNYWLALGMSTGSISNSSHISFAGTCGIAITLAGVSQSNVSVGLLGAATSASAHQLMLGLGVWTTNASLFSTSSLQISQISQVVSNPQLPFQFIRQA